MSDLRFIRVFQKDENAHYFLVGCFHSNSDNFEDSTLDLNVQSGAKGWSKSGLARPKSGHKEVLQRIATALQEREDDDKSVEFTSDGMSFKALFTETPNSLKVGFQWKEKGQTVLSRHQPFELPLQEGDSAMLSIFKDIQQIVYHAEESEEESQKAQSKFEKEAEKAQAMVKDFVKNKQDTGQQHFSRFAAVVNEKKKKIIELERQIAELKGVAIPKEASEDELEDEDEEEDEEQEEAVSGGADDKGDEDDDNHSMATTVDSAHARAEEGDLMDEDTQPLEDDADSEEGDKEATSSKPSRSKKPRSRR